MPTVVVTAILAPFTLWGGPGYVWRRPSVDTRRRTNHTKDFVTVRRAHLCRLCLSLIGSEEPVDSMVPRGVAGFPQVCRYCNVNRLGKSRGRLLRGLLEKFHHRSKVRAELIERANDAAVAAIFLIEYDRWRWIIKEGQRPVWTPTGFVSQRTAECQQARRSHVA